jgi:four helix bundle protein
MKITNTDVAFQLNKYLVDECKEYILLKQILRSGTSVGANVREAHNSETKPDLYIYLELRLKNVMKLDISWN